jgi:hypothetical protein
VVTDVLEEHTDPIYGIPETKTVFYSETLVSTYRITLRHNVKDHNMNQMKYLKPEGNLQVYFPLDFLNIETEMYLCGFSPKQQCS